MRYLLPFLLCLALLQAAKPKVAVVVDDCGYSLADAKLLAAIEQPLTMAVIPGQIHSRAAAEIFTAARRHAVLIHFPWTPLGNNRQAYPVRVEPGYSAAQIQAMLDKARESVPGAVGLNNHQGSILSANQEMMDKFMGVLRAQRQPLYFLDSRTTVNSRALSTARKYGIPAARNDIFLDGTQTETYIARRLAEAVGIAKRQGTVVVICHGTRPVTKRVLKKLLAQYNGRVDFVLLPEIIKLREKR
ncbi:putative catalytic domain of family 2 polysaccharide deacetylases [Candidatus Termititenax persephonae]|uniref:Catalytic domain of family 2 polysaccharide deacetylases n=1 Tax=Candidatus Termititenax persephonae TaxID=2218525 RepID=A0A388TJ64_9BACT|nr:putative catalytic domain of family 2 polysaccharide deacetylases [Candidatus Termititenax persephonae]